MTSSLLKLSILISFAFCFAGTSLSQTGDHILYGDLRVDETGAPGLKPISFEVILYTDTGLVIGRQTVSSIGRYRFNNLRSGWYNLVIEVESREVARIRVDLSSPLVRDFRKDIELAWNPTNAVRATRAVLAASDAYHRSRPNQRLFDKARKAIDKKEYEKSAALLRQLLASDRKDFQVWTELANVHFLQKDFPAAENEYLNALDLYPNFFLALLNLGRLEVARQKYDVAIEVLSKTVNVRPESADANYFLGEACLRLKRGSRAVGYFNEALRLDPVGMAEVHLQLAALYDAGGMKDKAASEYRKFLEKKPDYGNRKKLEQYIEANEKGAAKP